MKDYSVEELKYLFKNWRVEEGSMEWMINWCIEELNNCVLLLVVESKYVSVEELKYSFKNWRVEEGSMEWMINWSIEELKNCVLLLVGESKYVSVEELKYSSAEEIKYYISSYCLLSRWFLSYLK